MNKVSTWNILIEKAVIKKYVGLVSLLGIIVSFGLINAPIYGQAETDTQTETIPIDGQLSGNCANFENVQYTGKLRIITHTTLDPNGGFHGKTEVVFVGLKGVGETTGEKYRIQAASGSQDFASEDGSPVVQTVTGFSHITGGDMDEEGKLTVHFTVNANGEITGTQEIFTLDCD